MIAKTDKKPPSLAELTTEQEESVDPDYLAWKKVKISKTREAAHREPDKLISQSDMRARLGLEH